MRFQPDDVQRDLVEATRALAAGLPRSALGLLASHGLSGISLPEEVGGQGRTLLDAVLVLETVAEVNVAAGDCVQALNFGAIQQVAAHGTPDIVQRFLRPVLSGTKLVTIAMTEPDAGSAVTDLRTRAVRKGSGVALNGQKIFTTNADSADYFVVWSRFGPEPRDAGAVIVERGTPGFTIDSTHRFGSGESYGVLYFEDCEVADSNVLLDTDGFQKMLMVFNIERLGNATRSLAVGQAALTLALKHVRERKQFGRRLVEFQGLQWRLAEMELQLQAARLLLYRAAANANDGKASPIET